MFRSYHLPRPIFLPSFQSQRAERDSRDRDREETATGASCSISCNCIDKFPIKKTKQDARKRPVVVKSVRIGSSDRFDVFRKCKPSLFQRRDFVR